MIKKKLEIDLIGLVNERSILSLYRYKSDKRWSRGSSKISVKWDLSFEFIVISSKKKSIKVKPNLKRNNQFYLIIVWIIFFLLQSSKQN